MGDGPPLVPGAVPVPDSEVVLDVLPVSVLDVSLELTDVGLGDVDVSVPDVLVAVAGSGKVWTARAFPMLAPGSENTADCVLQHAVFSLADSQQYAPGFAYPSPTHSHTCTPPVPKLYADGLVTES